MATLATICGYGSVWTQLSAFGFLRDGGKINVSGLSEGNIRKIVAIMHKHSLEHPVWQPVKLVDGKILLGKEPDANGNVLFWDDETIIDSATGNTIVNHIVSTPDIKGSRYIGEHVYFQV